MWEKGVGYENDHNDHDDGGGGRRSVELEGGAVAFANKVNALGLALTKLKPFRERQEYVFKVLSGIGSTFFLVNFDHDFSYSLFEIPQYCIYYSNVYNYIEKKV